MLLEGIDQRDRVIVRQGIWLCQGIYLSGVPDRQPRATTAVIAGFSPRRWDSDFAAVAGACSRNAARTGSAIPTMMCESFLISCSLKSDGKISWIPSLAAIAMSVAEWRDRQEPTFPR